MTDLQHDKHTVDPISLPLEVLTIIVNQLPSKDVFKLRMVSRSWNNLFTSEYFVRPAIDSYKIDPTYRIIGEEQNVAVNHHLGKPSRVTTFNTHIPAYKLKDKRIFGTQFAYLAVKSKEFHLNVVELSTLRHTLFSVPKTLLLHAHSCFLSDEVAGIHFGNQIHWTDKLQRDKRNYRRSVQADPIVILTITEIPHTCRVEAYGKKIVGLFHGEKMGIWVFDTSTGVLTKLDAADHRAGPCSLHLGDLITVISWTRKLEVLVEQYKYCGEMVLSKTMPWLCGSDRRSKWRAMLRAAIARTVVYKVGLDRYSLKIKGDETFYIVVDLRHGAFTFSHKVMVYRDRIYTAEKDQMTSVGSGGLSVLRWKKDLRTLDLVMNDGYLVQVVDDEYLKLNVLSFYYKARSDRIGDWTWCMLNKKEQLVYLMDIMLGLCTEHLEPCVSVNKIGYPPRELLSRFKREMEAMDVEEVWSTHKKVIKHLVEVCEKSAGKLTAALFLMRE